MVYLTPPEKARARRAKSSIKGINKQVEKEFEPRDFEAFKRVLVGICEKFSAK